MSLWKSAFTAALLCAVGAVAQTVSGEVGVGAPVIGRVTGDQQHAAVAALGTDFVAVWDDTRDNRTADLYGAVVTATGVLTHKPSQALVRGGGQQTLPAVAVLPGAVLVAWVDGSYSGTCSEVVAQRFSYALAPLGPALRLTTGACVSGAPPTIASDVMGDRWLVAWGGHGASRDLHGAVVSGAGSVVTADFVISSAPNSQVAPTAAVSSTEFAVAWADDRTTLGTSLIYLATVNPAGSASAAVQVATVANGVAQRQPAMCWDGSMFGLTWLEALGPAVSPNAVYFKQTASVAATSSTASATLVTTSATYGFANPAIGCLGTTSVVTYDDGRGGGTGVYGKVFVSGTPASTELAIAPRTSTNRFWSKVAASATSFMVVLQGDPGDYENGWEVFGSALFSPAFGLRRCSS